jgi:predicted DsbA family dithiol-disulfide isomerase
LEHIPYKLIGPNVLKDGEASELNREEFFKKHVGEETLIKVQEAIGKWTKEKEIPITFQGAVSTTTRAHRLCRKAYLQGGQDMQVAQLLSIFKVHYGEGRDIADIELLSELAAQNNLMSKEQATAFLESNELEEEVNLMCEEVRKKGITDVPLILIDGKWAVKGGQSSDVFVQIFKRLASCSGTNSDCSPPVIDTSIA